MEEEFKNLYLYLPSNVKTERLLIGENNKINLLRKILDDSNKENLLKLIYNDASISEINLFRGMVFITEASLYRNGLFIKIEQKNQIRGSGYDTASSELLLLKDKGLYCITSADHGNYTIDGYNSDPMYSMIYEKIKKDMGEKADLKPFNKEFDRLVNKNKLNGHFKSKEREKLEIKLKAIYQEFDKLIYSYLDKINNIIIEDNKVKTLK